MCVYMYVCIYIYKHPPSTVLPSMRDHCSGREISSAANKVRVSKSTHNFVTVLFRCLCLCMFACLLACLSGWLALSLSLSLSLSCLSAGAVIAQLVVDHALGSGRP